MPGVGGCQVQRGAAPASRISRKKGSLYDLRMSAICKRMVPVCTQV